MLAIKNFIANFIEKIENTELSFWGGVFILYGIMFIRTFLENYANSLNFYHMSSFVDTFLHYPIFFSIIALSGFIIARIITKEEISKIAKFIVLCSFGLITPPIIDLIVNKGGQVPYVFIAGNYLELFKYFFTYIHNGTLGIRIEVISVLVGFGFYIFYKTKEIKRALLGIFLLYSAIFLMGVAPALFFSINNGITNEYPTVDKYTVTDFYFNKEPSNSQTSNRTFVADTVNDHNFYSLPQQRIFNQYSITLSIIFLLIHAVLLFWCLFLYSSKKFWVILKNFRYWRIFHYFIVLSMGIYLGAFFLGKNPIGSLFDFVSFVALFLALLFALLFTVWENDEADVEIDKVSNQDRPLAQIEPPVSIEEWKNLKYVFLAYSLCFAFLAGLYSFVFILLSIFIAHIYSAPPLRLKKFLGISSLLTATATVLVLWLGFFMAAGTESLVAFPARYSLGLLGIILLVENGKNVKDIEGDKKNGIKTLPTIFGERWGKLLTGLCLFLGSLLVPFVFYLNLYTFLTSIIFGIIFFLLTTKKIFIEKYLFFTYFAYILVFFILMNL